MATFLVVHTNSLRWESLRNNPNIRCMGVERFYDSFRLKFKHNLKDIAVQIFALDPDTLDSNLNIVEKQHASSSSSSSSSKDSEDPSEETNTDSPSDAESDGTVVSTTASNKDQSGESVFSERPNGESEMIAISSSEEEDPDEDPLQKWTKGRKRCLRLPLGR